MSLNLCIRIALIAGFSLLAACGGVSQRDGAPPLPQGATDVADAVPRAAPKSRYGNPRSYTVFGKRYYTLDSSNGYVKRGIASWYGSKFHGRRTSSGETYDMYAMTAAHKTLPLPTYVQVTNLSNGRRVVLKVNDRGPFHENRIIDLSYVAAAKLGVLKRGTAMVEVRAIGPDGSPSVVSVSTTPTPTASIGMFVQAGAFVEAANAKRLRDRLRSLTAYTVWIDQVEQGENALYRVRLGPVEGVDQVDRLIANLTGLGISGIRLLLE